MVSHHGKGLDEGTKLLPRKIFFQVPSSPVKLTGQVHYFRITFEWIINQGRIHVVPGGRTAVFSGFRVLVEIWMF